MKKFSFMFLLFSFCITSIFGFYAEDSQGDKRNYFSLSDSNVFVESSSNLNVLIEYELNLIEKNFTLNLSSCNSNQFCSNLELVDLFEEVNGSLYSTNEFTFIQGSNSFDIIIDTQDPVASFDSYVVNNEDKKLTLNFSYSDNYQNFSLVELYEKDGSSYDLIADVKGKNTYEITLDSSSDKEYLLKVEDVAGLDEEVSLDVDVGDIFEPILKSSKIILRDSKYYLNFQVEDSDLDSYEIYQGSISLNENIAGSSFSKEIILPFVSGTFYLNVTDDGGNVLSKQFKLNGDIDYNSFKSYNKNEIFTFRSDADSCFLVEVDGKTYNTKFEESKNNFEVDVNVDANEEIGIEFYCDRGDFREYLIEEFVYDNKKPTEVTLTGEVEDSGSLKLTWGESFDNFNDVEYSLIRDSKEIYDGSKLRFFDKDVEYPNSYEYELRVYDSAGNYFETEKIELTPKKIDVKLSLLGTDKQVQTTLDDYSFSLNSEKDAKVIIKVTNSNSLIYEDTITLSSNNLDLSIPLQDGSNQIKVEVTDLFGNKKEDSFYVVKEKEVLVSPPVLIEEKPLVEEKTAIIEDSLLDRNQTTLGEDEVIVDESSTWWIWLLGFILVLVFCIWYVVSHDREVKEKVSKVKRSTKKELDHYGRHRKEDIILGSSLEKAKKERIRKQKEKHELNLKKKQMEEKANQSKYNKEKLDDLSHRKQVEIPVSSRELQKKKVKKIRKDPSFNDELKKVEKDVEKRESFFKALISKRSKEPVKEDQFGEYLFNKSREDSWDSTQTYRSSYFEKKEAEKQAKIKAKQDEEKAKQLEKDQKEAEKQAKIRAKEEAEVQKQRAKEDRHSAKLSLDDYLDKRTKKKRWFFAERDVERDLKSRK